MRRKVSQTRSPTGETTGPTRTPFHVHATYSSRILLFSLPSILTENQIHTQSLSSGPAFHTAALDAPVILKRRNAVEARPIPSRASALKSEQKSRPKVFV